MSNIVPFSELNQIAKALSFNKMFGKSADELLPLMLIAQAEGKHPAIAAQEYDVIQGRPAINSKAALSRFQSAGGSIQWLKRTDDECSAKFAHPQGGELVITWTVKRAQQAGLTGKDNWKKYPTQMLSARVVAEGVRAVFPACLSGLYTSEEVQDMPPIVVNPVQPAAIAERFTPTPAPDPVIEAEPLATPAQLTDLSRRLSECGYTEATARKRYVADQTGGKLVKQLTADDVQALLAGLTPAVADEEDDFPDLEGCCPECGGTLVNGACRDMTCPEGREA